MNTENPYSAETAIDEEAKQVRGYRVAFFRIFVAWLSFCLITFLATLALSLTIGALLVLLLVSVGADRGTAQAIKPIYAQLCGFVLPIPVSLWCYWWSVHRFILRKLDPPRD